MNELKDILNKMKFVPEHMQDKVLENIVERIEEEINKSCNPVDLVVERLKELNFGNNENEEIDRKIIRIIANCLPEDWFFMKPRYCESVERTKKHDNWTQKWKVNEVFDRFIKQEIKDKDDDDQTYWLIREIAQQSNAMNVDIIKDSYWIYKDGANWETWLYTTKELANEMSNWFIDCFYSSNEEDETCYKILNELEKSFPKKD